MKKPTYPLWTVFLLFLCLPLSPARAAEERIKPKDARADENIQDVDELKKSAPKVYIDSTRVDINYIRTEITFVNYVWDRKEADVHVLITQQRTGGGGREYTLAFIGLNGYADLKNELKFYTNRTETEDEIRRGLVQMLKLGLAPYAARTPISRILTLSTDRAVRPTAVADRWNFWVFSVSLRGRLYGEMSRRSDSINGNLSVNRVTPASRIRLGVSASVDESRYDYGGYKEYSATRGRSFDGLYVKSLNDHWSVGGFLSVYYSSYSNIDLGLNIAPAVEYDIFPYAESTRRQLRLLYRLGYGFSKYLEETIYDKLSDRTLNESLAVTLSLTEPWGSTEVSLEGSHYFHNFKYNRLRLSAGLSLRILKGLALTVDGRYAAVHDQLSLRKSEISLDELLLRRTELATDYSYSLSVGFSYSFGSVYSNVVNPRFGGGFGGPGSFGGYY